MRNPFKKSNNKTPEGEPLERIGDLVPSSKKLVIIAAMVTFIIIIIVMSESVVIVRNTICRAGHTIRSTYTQISG
jgi:hypothetical protein